MNNFKRRSPIRVERFPTALSGCLRNSITRRMAVGWFARGRTWHSCCGYAKRGNELIYVMAQWPTCYHLLIAGRQVTTFDVNIENGPIMPADFNGTIDG